MKVSAAKRAEHQESILSEAARIIRERGTDRWTVNDVMSAAGLTHGGFYGHFSSKEELTAAAIKRASDDTCKQLEQALGEQDLKEYLDRYLSWDHLTAPGTGCVMACIATEIPRSTEQVVGEFSTGIARFISSLERHGRLTREEAISKTAAIVGAMILARAVASHDPDLASQFLRSR